MNKNLAMFVLIVLPLLFLSCADQGTKKISVTELQDKIAGGWAGKMIGVSYGAPTEFRAVGETYEEELKWEPQMVDNSLHQDDIYVQLSFMMAMDKYGIDAPAEKLAESFANAGYRLWHANVQARKNFWDGILPPESGSPEYNLHADDIDFQIEADYIGFMCPGMPQTSNKIADKVGRIMNYGDGVYGGMFVGALYAEAYLEKNISTIVNRALLAIPAESGYGRCVQDVIDLHAKYPSDWRAAWQVLEDKWGAVDICGALNPFNIDAKLNGAYIVMGLLYGNGDFGKTMEVSLRCGQDSDCNPSNAAGVIGIMSGYSALADEWKSGIEPLADSLFIYTDYTFNSAVEKTLSYAKQLIKENGGTVTDTDVTIKRQEPVAPPLEVSFPNTMPDYQSSVFDAQGWTWKGDWKTLRGRQRRSEGEVPIAKYADKKGAEVNFKFSGTGVVLTGNWAKDGGKADVFVDGRKHRNIDAYYWWANEGKRNAFLWHVLNLEPGEHTVRLVLTGDKKPDSEGTRIYVSSATVYKVASL
jgi:hypothetical protein